MVNAQLRKLSTVLLTAGHISNVLTMADDENDDDAPLEVSFSQSKNELGAQLNEEKEHEERYNTHYLSPCHDPFRLVLREFQT